MSSELSRVRARWQVHLIACLFGSMIAPPILAAPLPPPLGLGAKVLGTGGTVTLRTVPTDAALTSEIFYFSDAASGFLGTNHSSTEDTRGPIPDGMEILIHIRLDAFTIFETGPASRNLDNLPHAIVRPKDATTLEVKFEDILGGGDRDFDDVILEIEGAKMSVPFAGLPLSPGAGSDMAFDQSGALTIIPILAGDPSGVSISLGNAEGWQGTIGFDGGSAAAQLNYTARSAPGLPDLIGRHTTSAADGLTDLELIFPRAAGRSPLQVAAFLAGEKVAETAVNPRPNQPLTFAPARYLEARKVKKIKIKKITVPTPIGPVTIEDIEIVFGLTSGEIEGVGNLSFDTLELTFGDEGFPPSGLSEIELGAVNVPSLTLETQSVSAFNRLHRELGGATLAGHGGTLTVDGEFDDDQSHGVIIDLGAAVESFDLNWSTLLPLGLSLIGSSIEVSSRGVVHGVPDQDLGFLRIRQLTTADTDAEIMADFSAVGSPTQRILVYDQNDLLADVSGHTGPVALTSAWPVGVGKGDTILGPLRLPCYSLPFPEDTWIQVPGGPWLRGDKLLVLAENPEAGVKSVSELSLRATMLSPITLTHEAATPLPEF